MTMITAQQAAEKWGTSVRNVQDLCKRGRIVGAERWGAAWMIPGDAPKPLDGRSREGKTHSNIQPLLRKSPFLTMTDLYCAPGKADSCAKALSDYPQAQELFAAQTAYNRGQFDIVCTHAPRILSGNGSIYAVIAGSMVLGQCAIWTGDPEMFRRAKKHICEAPWKTETDREILTLALACTDLSVRNTKDFPEWFTCGCFDKLPKDSLPAAYVYYIKYLLSCSQETTLGTVKRDTPQSAGLNRTLPYILEPLISQVSADKIILAEIHLRLLCAVAYNQSGYSKRAAQHLDKAIALALPDRLLAPFAEYRRHLGLLIDERLTSADHEAAATVKELHKQYTAGWTKLHNAVLEKNAQVSLSSKEREVARLAAFGMTNVEIASSLNLSVHSISTMITQAKSKTGVDTRTDLGLYL